MFRLFKQSKSVYAALILGGLLIASVVGADSAFMVNKFYEWQKALPVFMIQARVAEINPTDLKIAWRGENYEVKIPPAARLLSRDGKPADLEEFKVGNIVRLWANRWDNNVLEAKIIYNQSLNIDIKTVIGYINNLKIDEFQFTLDSSTHGKVKVKADANVKILNRGQVIGFSDLKNGQKVIVKGLFDRSLLLISPAQKIIIFPN
ncbi:MAG: hypothetical protein WC621_04780 [Patescibacteria group bacterium]